MDLQPARGQRIPARWHTSLQGRQTDRGRHTRKPGETVLRLWLGGQDVTLTEWTVLAYLAAPLVVTLTVMVYAIVLAVYEHYRPSQPVPGGPDD
jgi:hypothetical protein